MASQKALTKTQPTALAVTGDPVTAALTAYREGCNVLAPVVHMPELPAGTRIVVSLVKVDPSKEARETFPIAGGDLLLGKVALSRISQAAGVSWTSTRRVDDGKHPHLYQAEVKGYVTDFTGRRREVADQKTIDLREDAGGGIPGKDFDEIVTKAEKGNRDPSGQLMEARKFIAEIATSKAKNRAIADVLGIKRSYTKEELSRPFAVPQLTLDPNDREARALIQANAGGAQEALFGARAKVIDATFEEAAQPAPGSSPGDSVGSPAGEVGGEGAQSSPPANTEDAEGDAEVGSRAVLDAIKVSWTLAKNAGMTAQAFGAACKSATGKARKEEMTVADATAVAKAVAAFIEAKQSDDGDMPI